MPARPAEKPKSAAKPTSAAKPKPQAKPVRSPAAGVKLALAELKAAGRQSVVDGVARYAISAPKVFGVPVGTIRALGKKLGRDHAMALALWETGWYEARVLASFVD